MTVRTPIPFRPAYSAARLPNVGAFYRAAAALLLAEGRQQHYNEVLRPFAASDTAVEIVFKATTSPANTTTSTNAAELVGLSVGSLAVLAGASAAGKLFASNPTQQYVFDGYGSALLPPALSRTR